MTAHVPSEPAVRGDGMLSNRWVSARSRRTGVLASLILCGFYVAVVAGSSRSFQHLLTQARQDWYFLVLIVVGFGIQVALFAELRRIRHVGASATASGRTGAGASVVGMVACCAHHIADLVPFIAATGLAAFVFDYRILLMVLGIGVNGVGIVLSARRLAGMRRHQAGSISKEAHACDAS